MKKLISLCLALSLLLPTWAVLGSAQTTLVVDNGDSGFSTDSLWTESWCASGYYGHSYLHDGGPEPRPGGWAKWTPEIETAGDYQIYLLWTSCQKRAGDVPIEVRHQNGTDTGKYADQTRHGGEWVYVGTYPLSAGESCYVKISAENAGYTIADAAKFVYVPPGAAPEPPDGTPRVNARDSFPLVQQAEIHTMSGNVRGVGMLAEYEAPGPLQIRIQRTTHRPASEPYVPTALARVFDPDGNLAAWADFTDQQEGTAAQLLTVPPSKSGIYRISFSGGRTGDLIEIGLPQTEIWGIRGEMALGLTGTLPETLYLMTAQTTPVAAGDEHRNMLPTGFLTLETFKGAAAELFDHAGKSLGTPRKTGSRTLLTIDTPPNNEIWSLRLGKSGAIAIDGIPGLLCPSREAALALRGGTVDADGVTVAGPLQARLRQAMLRLGTELDINPDYPANAGTAANPQLEVLAYGQYSVLSSLDCLQKSQRLDSGDPRYGQIVDADGNRAVNLLAGPAVTPGALNPVYQNTALIKRAILNSMSELVWMQGDDLCRTGDLRSTAYPIESILLSYNTLIAETYALLKDTPLLLPEEREAWKQAVMAVSDKLANFQGYQSNQWAFLMLGQLNTYAATGEARFLKGFERSMTAYLDNAHGASSKFGQHPAGYFLEEGGPDGNYDSLNAYHLAAAYQIYQDMPEANLALCEKMREGIDKNLRFKSFFWLEQPDGGLFAPTAMNCRQNAPISSTNYPGDYLTRAENGLSLRRHQLNRLKTTDTNGVGSAISQSHIANTDAWARATLNAALAKKGALAASPSGKGAWLPTLHRAFAKPISAEPAPLPAEAKTGIWELPGLIAFQQGGIYGVVFYKIDGSARETAGKFGGGPAVLWSKGTGNTVASMRNLNGGAVETDRDLTHSCIFGYRADNSLFYSGGEAPELTWIDPGKTFLLSARLPQIDGTLQWQYALGAEQLEIAVTLRTDEPLHSVFVNLPVFFNTQTALQGSFTTDRYIIRNGFSNMVLRWDAPAAAQLAEALPVGGNYGTADCLRIPLRAGRTTTITVSAQP